MLKVVFLLFLTLLFTVGAVITAPEPVDPATLPQCPQVVRVQTGSCDGKRCVIVTYNNGHRDFWIVTGLES